MPGVSASTGSPAKDSVVVTWTALGVSMKSRSCTPVIPPDASLLLTADAGQRCPCVGLVSLVVRLVRWEYGPWGSRSERRSIGARRIKTGGSYE
jgi:hypothetical protein